LVVGLVVRGLIADLMGGQEVRQVCGLSRLSTGEAPGLVHVKWPNDVLIDGRKVAGILCERKQGTDIIGIGINVSHAPDEVPAELRDSIIALSDVGVSLGRWEVLATLAEMIRRRIVADPLDVSWTWVLRTWPAHDAMLGRIVEVFTPQGSIIGEAGGIDDSGRLRLVTSGGVLSVVSGTIRPRDSS
jgi:BirA family biotin operon repressor/biotin-[acetyl-CoA-carboxylase] ligase